MKLKKILAMFLALAMVFSLAACSNSGDNPGGGNTQPGNPGGNTQAPSGGGSDGPIDLTLWGAEEDQNLLADLVEKFKAAYPDQTFNITIGVESESTARDTILTDVEAAADVYAFACDQLPTLVDAGAILELSQMEAALQSIAGKSLADIAAANGEGATTAASYNGKQYAFPFASDGFFMFYDPDYISEEQANDWITLLDAAQAGGKQVGMTLASGWYNACFFYGAGFVTGLNADGTTVMDWNGTSASGVSGVDVVKYMQSVAGHPAFLAVPDGGISAAITSGSLAAVISGTWDTSTVSKTFGEDYVARRLPTMTINGKTFDTRGVSSFKCIGVNPFSKNAGWAVILAEFLTNEESQVTRFEQREIPPTNIKAASSDAVKSNKGVVGLVDAASVGIVQLVGGNYWDPTASFGEQIAQGTIGSDDAAIQSALDLLVQGATAPIN